MVYLAGTFAENVRMTAIGKQNICRTDMAFFSSSFFEFEERLQNMHRSFSFAERVSKTFKKKFM